MSESVMRRAVDLLSVVCILCLAAYGIFWLPYSFPPTETTSSPSFDVGFGNRVSVLAVVAAIGLLCIRNLLSRQAIPEPVDLLFCPPTEAGQKRFPAMPKSILLFFAGFYLVVPILLYRCFPCLEMWSEPMSYLPRLELGWRYHFQLYSEIDWAYGPALFYVPTMFIAVGRHLVGHSRPRLPDLLYMRFPCRTLVSSILWTASGSKCPIAS